MEEQRMKWDAKATFKSLNAQGKRRQASIDDERLKTTPYTPPPNVAAWLKAQADKPKPRDYDAILRAAKKAPVGYYEDAPRGIRFGDNPIVIPDNYPCECRQRDDGTWVHLDESCKVHGLAPTPPHSADGGKPLLSAGHGKDVDGPWPKCVNWFGIAVYVFAGPAKNQGLYHRDDGTTDRAAGDYADRLRNGGVSMSTPEASQWLEQNGHKDVAAQLRGKEEFEPVGTIAREGDTVVWPWHQYDSWRRVPHTLRYTAPCVGFDAYYDGYLEDVFSKPDGDPLALRVLKRPLAASRV